MTANTVFHRRYLRFMPPQTITDMAADHSWLSMGTDRIAQNYLDERSYTAWLISAAGLKPTRIAPHAGQVFQLAATPFELAWSTLCGVAKFDPVVDDSFSVVGHTGWVQDRMGLIFVQKGSEYKPLPEIVEAGLPAVVARSNPASADYAELSGFSDNSWNVLTDPDGKILLVLGVHDRGGDMEPAIDPFVLFSLGQIAVAVGKGLGKYLVRKVVAKLAALSAGKAFAKDAALIIERKIEGDALRETARQLLAKQPPGRSVVNLAGTGEVEGAINVNPLLDQQVHAVPNLVKAKAEGIGDIFPPGSVDKIVSNNVVNGQIEWEAAARGAMRVLKSGGTVSIAPYAGQLATQVAVIKAALVKAGFKSLEDIGGVVVTAVK